MRADIGLEMHVHLATRTKAFCSCRAAFGDAPNSNVCPVCLGYPGILPTLNAEAVRLAYIVAQALHCTLSSETTFERKNYYYPDLPKNYQISQFGAPLGRDGFIMLEHKQVRIREVHLEEDAGKMIHVGDISLLDFNRAGVPLLEIVTEPDLQHGAEAEELLLLLRSIVRYLEVSDGNMEEGSLRCDANVSVRPAGAALGAKVEIKNMNSSRFVRRALDYEIGRQKRALKEGSTIVQETRLWNENQDRTMPMRRKEYSEDYRYFPEPDLPTFIVDDAFLQSVAQAQVELPSERAARLVGEYGIDVGQAAFLCEERATAEFFERCAALLDSALGAPAIHEIVVWLTGEVRKHLNRRGESLAASPLTPERLAELLKLKRDGTIHAALAKRILAVLFNEDKSPGDIIAERGWDTAAVDPTDAIKQVTAVQEKAVALIRAGNERPLDFLVGQVMKLTAGQAEPQHVRRLLRQSIENIDNQTCVL